MSLKTGMLLAFGKADREQPVKFVCRVPLTKRSENFKESKVYGNAPLKLCTFINRLKSIVLVGLL